MNRKDAKTLEILAAIYEKTGRQTIALAVDSLRRRAVFDLHLRGYRDLEYAECAAIIGRRLAPEKDWSIRRAIFKGRKVFYMGKED